MPGALMRGEDAVMTLGEDLWVTITVSLYPAGSTT